MRGAGREEKEERGGRGEGTYYNVFVGVIYSRFYSQAWEVSGYIHLKYVMLPPQTPTQKIQKNIYQL